MSTDDRLTMALYNQEQSDKRKREVEAREQAAQPSIEQEVAQLEAVEAIQDKLADALRRAETAEHALEAAEQVECDIRRMLWLNHGCSVAGLYGDDGEMQCADVRHAIFDFKRDDFVSLVLFATAARAHTAEQQLTEAQERITALEGALRAKVKHWRKEGAARDLYHATMGIGWKVCADELDVLLTPSAGSQKE